ncbi:MAG: DNA polymerase III subunit chi [Pseudomonadota bacterium]
MTQQVDFYLLPAAGAEAGEQFAARLAAKVYQMSLQVHVQCASPAAAQRLDDLLWTFSDDSFVPHELWQASDDPAPVTLGSIEQPLPEQAEVIINLSEQVCATPDPRIAEIVPADDPSKARGRQRYATYRDRGCELKMHTL